MFSFSKDKVGFFSALALTIIAAGTLIATMILLFMGVYRGNWEYYSLSLKIVLGVSWLVCIAIVWARVNIYDRQRIRNRKAAASNAQENPVQENK